MSNNGGYPGISNHWPSTHRRRYCHPTCIFLVTPFPGEWWLCTVETHQQGAKVNSGETLQDIAINKPFRIGLAGLARQQYKQYHTLQYKKKQLDTESLVRCGSIGKRQFQWRHPWTQRQPAAELKGLRSLPFLNSKLKKNKLNMGSVKIDQNPCENHWNSNYNTVLLKVGFGSLPSILHVYIKFGFILIIYNIQLQNRWKSFRINSKYCQKMDFEAIPRI